MIILLLNYLILANAAPWTPENSPWNLNQNRTATQVSDYAVSWPNHTYFPSPENWRMPFYTIMPDRYADGDPINNQVEGSPYEWDPAQVNFHFGGDMQGMINRLDYLYDLGVRGLYVAGTPLKNLPWDSHFYNPIDFTLIDAHLGTLADWRAFVAAAHAKGMYVVIDLTITTAGNLLQFNGFVNQSTPQNYEQEYSVSYKTPKTYVDFVVNNTWDPNCKLGDVVFYNESAYPIYPQFRDGCYDSDFNQYGDLEAFGSHPNWQRQLTKFAGVQDRLKDWRPKVQEKIIKLLCLTIQGLDIDGIRTDKAMQFTLQFVTDVLGPGVRSCAAAVNKNNFFLPGEITSGVDFAMLYVGRGRTPDLVPLTEEEQFPPYGSVGPGQLAKVMRPYSNYGLDSAAFSYSIYRGLLDFLGLKGDLLAPDDVGPDPILAWQDFQRKLDYSNAYTGKMDPRDMYGVGNQDTFRWASIVDGINRYRLGQMITTLLLPGMPVTLFGDEQAFIIHDSRSENYIYGRQPMVSTDAWQTHGCYRGNASYQFRNMPFTEESRNACNDDHHSMDHFNQTHPSYLFTQNLYNLYETYPILKNGFRLETLLRMNLVEDKVSIGRNLWSASKNYHWFQNHTYTDGAYAIWFLFTNSETPITITDSCSSKNPILAPYHVGQSFRSLFPPYQYVNVTATENGAGGCLDSLTLPAFGFMLLVPVANFEPPKGAIVSFSPNHDTRLVRLPDEKLLDVPVVIQISETCSCDSILQHVKAVSYSGASPVFDPQTVQCKELFNQTADYGILPAKFQWFAVLRNVPDGLTEISVDSSLAVGTPARPIIAGMKSLLRVGLKDNVLVFTKENAYNPNLLALSASNNSELEMRHAAVGADLMRYTIDFSISWSEWVPYSARSTIPLEEFKKPRSSGRLSVKVQYWCKVCGSSAYLVTSEVDPKDFSSIDSSNRQNVPSLNLLGEFNSYGNDIFSPISMKSHGNNLWSFKIEWHFPTTVTIDVWGDKVFSYGDINHDYVLDRLPPDAQDFNVVTIPEPPYGFTSWILQVNDTNMSYELIPDGVLGITTAYFFILAFVPVLLGVSLVFCFRYVFYKIIWNSKGRIEYDHVYRKTEMKKSANGLANTKMDGAAVVPIPSILIATLEYEIPDWNIKVRIGGLGVIASLMGAYLKNSIVWVVPMVAGVEYPATDALKPIELSLYGKTYTVNVYQHIYKNVKYILLDAAIFKSRTKKDPYTAKMDDLASAVFYSAWNQCIAEIIRREDVDIYHMNDFHCAIAPLYLLPKIIPCALSLHNAEFQGLWPLRTQVELENVCAVFNLPIQICQKYVQYGNTFNLLHGAAMYLHYHQKGYGAGGVSDKYGDRCIARYPTLWSLSEMSSIQNPNPADFDELTDGIDIVSSEKDLETIKMEDKIACQHWAFLEEGVNKTVFVFVGRWSRQKGLDLIADLAPKLLHTYPDAQIIVVGPVIDLHGRLAAMKLQHLMSLYPQRVFVKPEFTSIPACVFKGCDFVLLPSRDEPFGLVAVEFGRNGVLGIGSFVGGLGTMPGWWFPIESSEPQHLLNQFWDCIQMAMKSTPEVRKAMALTAMNQRFPISEWREKLQLVYSNILKIHGHKDYATIRRDQQDKDTKPSLAKRFVRSGLFDVDMTQTAGSSRASLFKGFPKKYNRPDNNSIVLLKSKDKNISQISIGSSESMTIIDNAEEADMIFHGTLPRATMTLDAISKMDDIIEYEMYYQYNDEEGELQSKFYTWMTKLNPANSTDQLCIDKILRKEADIYYSNAAKTRLEESLIGTVSLSSRFCQSLLQYRIGTWPFYAILLAIGQLISANTFQLVLLTGAWTSSDTEFNMIGVVFIIGTFSWWILYRKAPSVHVVSFPMFVFGAGLFFSGLPISGDGAIWIKRLAVWCYAFASSAGSLYFALNFGEEAGVNMSSWIFRASVFEGVRQLWTMALWYWSQTFPLDNTNAASLAPSTVASVFSFIFAILLVLVGYMLYHGLPSCYHHAPSVVPRFYSSFKVRGLAIWFIVAQFLQAYWLSGPYGRNWQFLWGQPIPAWQTFLIILVFVGVWIGLLAEFWHLSQTHSWILPIFAVGLLSPRWAQMSWSTSDVGLGLYWPGGIGPYFSLGLWLWLAVLDALQAVGLSMMLLQTLTRVHVSGTLMFAQLMGAVAFILARTTAPNSHGPGDIFPNPSNSASGHESFWVKPLFWVGLIFQIIISLGYLFWFRREQLSKP